ncbi:hypothetical protein ANN_06154 [Periplaneta americana]|uniref:Uncharacterized protein n=1 Tax=Periplaneta americana TaxID=6978 RepID=A0ABQ8TEX7_PERAM|nr:hypothetical protein ANN_06154 [Periplaneta americana]
MPLAQALCRSSELLPVLSPAGRDGPQCSGSHGQGRTEEADREHEIPGNNGALAPVKEHSCLPVYRDSGVNKTLKSATRVGPVVFLPLLYICGTDMKALLF